MKRRHFLRVLGGAAAAWPAVGRAQHPALPVIGFVSTASPRGGYQRSLSAFLKGLEEAGFADGRNVTIEYRWAEGRNDRLPSLVADLVQRKVNLIAAPTTPAALAARAGTDLIPVVFTTVADPVHIGLVMSLNRPGRNLTGVTLLSVEVGPKLLELLHDLVPGAATMGLLINPTNPNVETQTRNLEAATARMGMKPIVLMASTERDFEVVFANLREQQVRLLMISQDPFFNTQSAHLAELSVRNALAAIYTNREFAAAGGVMSYGASQPEAWHQIGMYAGRILKGEKPGELPVVQPTKFELLINLKTAKVLELTVPPTLLASADEVIE